MAPGHVRFGVGRLGCLQFPLKTGFLKTSCSKNGYLEDLLLSRVSQEVHVLTETGLGYLAMAMNAFNAEEVKKLRARSDAEPVWKQMRDHNLPFLENTVRIPAICQSLRSVRLSSTGMSTAPSLSRLPAVSRSRGPCRS